MDPHPISLCISFLLRVVSRLLLRLAARLTHLRTRLISAVRFSWRASPETETSSQWRLVAKRNVPLEEPGTTDRTRSHRRKVGKPQVGKQKAAAAIVVAAGNRTRTAAGGW